MGRTLEAFKEALGKIEAIREETWTDENWNLELTRALTTLDNARMEWNSARLKFKVLDGPVGGGGVDGAVAGGLGASNFAGLNRQQLMTFGLAIALPVAVALFLGLVVLGLMLRHR